VATRTGDDGTTGLGNNTRVSKASARPHAMGDVDELNSQIGLLLCEPMPDDVRQLLTDIQDQLFNLGGELSIPGFALLKDEALAQLDEALAHYNKALPRLEEFILPAGTRAACLAHVARTVARRAERAVVSLQETEEMRPRAAQIPQSPLGPALRALARAQPHERGHRGVLEEREAGALSGRGLKLQRGSSIAIVIREVQVASPASLTMSICQTCVRRPMCRGRAVPVTQPLVADRRWLALISSPTAL